MNDKERVFTTNFADDGAVARVTQLDLAGPRKTLASFLVLLLFFCLSPTPPHPNHVSHLSSLWSNPCPQPLSCLSLLRPG